MAARKASTSDAEALRSLVAVMREMGVTHYAKGDVVIDLAPVAPNPSAPITLEQQERIRREAARQHEDMLYASSEGFPMGDMG